MIPRWLVVGIVQRTGSVGLRRFLAFGAKVSRSARQANARHRRSTPPTRLARASIGPELVLVLSHESGAANIITDAGAAFVDAAAQDSGNGAAEPVRLSRRQVFAEQGGR